MKYDKKADEVVVDATDIRRFGATWPDGALRGLMEVRVGVASILSKDSEQWDEAVWAAIGALAADAELWLVASADSSTRADWRREYRAEERGFPWWWRWAT